MIYTYSGSRLRSIFLGSENELLETKFHVKCPKCKGDVFFSFNEIQSIKGKLLDFTKASNLLKETQYGVEVKAGVPAYAISTKCKVCHMMIHIIIGAKEVQPQRFSVYIKTVIIESSSAD